MSPKSTPHKIFNWHDQGAKILNGTKHVKVRYKEGLSGWEPLEMESRTCVVNACKRKGRHRVANRGKVAADLPIRRFLVGSWRMRERTVHHVEHQRDEFHATL